MKFISRLLLLALVANQTLAGLPPPTIKGQSDATAATTFNLQVPYNQSTKINGTTKLIESGNQNLLLNASFEHSTFSTSWTLINGSWAVETTNISAGKQSGAITLSAIFADVISQVVTPTVQMSGVNFEYGMWVKTSQTTVSMCGLQAGVEIGCAVVPSTNTWQYVAVNYPGPASGSVGVKIKTTASTTGTVYVDDAYVGKARNVGSVQSYTEQVTALTSSGTYVVPLGTVYLEIEMVGGGGGGGAAGGSGSTSGGNTTFGTSFLTANGGVGGANSLGTYTAGGTATGGDINITGGDGGAAVNAATIGNGGAGGNSFFGGGGQVSVDNGSNNINGRPGTALGSGGGGNLTVASGAGGGSAGGYLKKLITSTALAASYSYSVGAAGGAGTGGTGSTAGGVGVVGTIIARAWLPGGSQQVYSANVGPFFTSSAAYTPTFTGLGTVANINFTWRRDANYLYVNGSANAGTVTATVVTVSLPTGLTIDSSLPTNSLVGIGDRSTTASANNALTFLGSGSGTTVGVALLSVASSNPNTALGGTSLVATGDLFYVNFAVPISGWTAPFLPVPILVGSVTSNSSGTERVERAHIANPNGSCSIGSQSGSWLSSCSWSSAGVMTLNITAGMFSASPSCSVVCTTSGFACGVRIQNGPSTASLQTLTTATTTGTNTDAPVDVICMGPR